MYILKIKQNYRLPAENPARLLMLMTQYKRTTTLHRNISIGNHSYVL